jgi:uncharacterized protein (DUF2236 family)
MIALISPRSAIDRSYTSIMARAHLPGEQYTDPPGDPGLFGPDSAIWKVHSDVSGVIGGISGLILGALNEPVTYGTNRFSDYMRDPLKRLGLTASFVVGVTFGATPVAERLIETVRKMHRPVRGTMPDGRAFSASGSDDINWVGTTQAYSIARAHLRYHPHPLRGADLDRYFAEYAVISERLGAEGPPRSMAEAEEYLERMRPRLTVSEEVLETVRFLRRGYGPNAPARAASLVLNRASTDLLPDWAKRLLGLAPRTPVTPVLARAGGHVLTRMLRLSVSQPYLEQAHARCAASPG